jgi:hypothetical protein
MAEEMTDGATIGQADSEEGDQARACPKSNQSRPAPSKCLPLEHYL